MSKLTAIVLFALFLSSSALAKPLEITVEQTQIKLPYWVAKNPHYGAVIIVKGGQIAEWSVLLSAVAKQLSHYGWSTVLLNSKKEGSTPWVAQLPETISALRQDNNQRIILVHYGDQLNQSLEYFSKPQAKTINGMIMLSAYDDQNAVGLTLKNVRFPLYDIVGQFDYDRVHRQMRLREKQFNQTNYHAVEMPGAQHDYEYSQKMLIAFVHGWMSKLPEFKPQPAPILSSYIEPVLFLVSHIASIDGFNTTNL